MRRREKIPVAAVTSTNTAKEDALNASYTDEEKREIMEGLWAFLKDNDMYLLDDDQ
jgi:hypothetical protein